MRPSGVDQPGMSRRVRRIHMVGVGGTGMSGIAEVLVNLGYEVAGSDLRASETTERLAGAGVDVRIGHDPSNVVGADVVVVSTAVAQDNVEVEQARARKIPVIRRAEMLAELMRLKLGVAIAGSHGKTTTTSMVGQILARSGLDPTVVVGGKLNALGSNARLGGGPLMVVEADESDGSFLSLSPTIAVVTNIDSEHLDYYPGGLDELRYAFRTFLTRLPFYGLAVACIDDPMVKAVLRDLERRTITYGFGSEADLQAVDLQYGGSMTSFEVLGRSGSRGRYRLAMLGRHNVLNALAALAVADELGVPLDFGKAGLEDFDGVDRRFSVRGTIDDILVVDDYGHHPTEIAATLEGARAGHSGRRILVVFQPHRYTRTANLLGAFAKAFKQAAVVYVLPVYAAGEKPIRGADQETLIETIRGSGHPDVRGLAGLAAVTDELLPELHSGDLVIAFGAGDVGRLGRELVDALRASKSADGSARPGGVR